MEESKSMEKIGNLDGAAVTKRADAKIRYVSVLFWWHILRDNKCGKLFVQKLFWNIEYFGRGDKMFGKNQDCQKGPSHSNSI